MSSAGYSVAAVVSWDLDRISVHKDFVVLFQCEDEVSPSVYVVLSVDCHFVLFIFSWASLSNCSWVK